MPEPSSCQGRDVVQVGTVTAVFGLKGWVKVFSYTDPIESIVDYQPWLIKRGESEQLAEVAQARCQSKKIQVRMRGYHTRDQAEALVGMEIWVERQLFSALDEDEYYWFELKGLAVVNELNERLGTMDSVLETGANDVLVVVPDHTSIDQQERLIPYVQSEVVNKVDLKSGLIRVNWPRDY
jgi:16S rRNA processing protein RimM